MKPKYRMIAALNHNYTLIHALLALHEMQDTKGYGYENATAEIYQRCARWLDAMVPPLSEDEEEGHDQADVATHG